MKLFGDIVNQVAENLQLPNTDNYVKVQVRKRLNDAYRMAWDSQEWETLTDIPVSFTVPANKSTVILPKKWAFLIRAYNPSTLEPIPILEGNAFGDQTRMDFAAGNPTSGFIQLCNAPASAVQVQLSAAGIVKVNSTVTSDKAVPVFVKGEDANGNVISETILTNSTDGTVLVSGTLTFTKITGWTKNLVPSGGVFQLFASDGVTLLSQIDPFSKLSLYRVYQANITPTADMTLSGTAKLAFQPMINTYDHAFTDMDDYLIAKTTALCWKEHRNPESEATYERLAAEAMSLLVGRDENQEGAVELLIPQGRA